MLDYLVLQYSRCVLYLIIINSHFYIEHFPGCCISHYHQLSVWYDISVVEILPHFVVFTRLLGWPVIHGSRDCLRSKAKSSLPQLSTRIGCLGTESCSGALINNINCLVVHQSCHGLFFVMIDLAQYNIYFTWHVNIRYIIYIYYIYNTQFY